MSNNLMNLVYAGFGIMEETKQKAKEKYNSYVEAGKKYDKESGKHRVNDFFKLIEDNLGKFEPKIEEIKNKLEDFKSNFLKKKEVKVKA